MADIILFDLDGTLTDPKEGITKSVRYGLEALGYFEPDLDKLTPFIGPPLTESYMEFYGLTKEEAEKAVEKYRERFRIKGMYENEIYDGIREMLIKLRKAGKRLGVATSKPWVFAEPILEYFHIKECFEHIVGSELNGKRVRKGDVIKEALNRFQIKDRRNVLMVGDRKHDIFGAKEAGIFSVGVTYGFGGRKELTEAGADYIVETVGELTEFLLKV